MLNYTYVFIFHNLWIEKRNFVTCVHYCGRNFVFVKPSLKYEFQVNPTRHWCKFKEAERPKSNFFMTQKSYNFEGKMQV